MAVALAAPQYHHQAEHEAPAEYEFSYSVHDDHTGDIKSQQESRKGDVVTGQYELIDSDGFKRIVTYTADDHSGFNAVVHREPTDIKIPVPVAKAPVHHYSHAPAPVAHHYSAPAPVTHEYSHVPAPVHKVFTPVVTKTVEPVVAKVIATPAPVVHYQPAPVAHYQPAKVAHYQPAPVAHHYSAPAPKTHQYSHEPAHVTFNAPEVNYHY